MIYPYIKTLIWNKSLYNTSVPVWTIRTQMARCYITGTTTSNYWVVYTWNVSNSGSWQLFWIRIRHDGNWNHPWTANWKDGISPSSLNISWWTHIVGVGDWTNHTLYVNWQLVSSNNYSAITSSTGIYIWWVTSWSDDPYQWYMSNVILESKGRTAQEISDYYNQTKWNYWIS